MSPNPASLFRDGKRIGWEAEGRFPGHGFSTKTKVGLGRAEAAKRLRSYPAPNKTLFQPEISRALNQIGSYRRDTDRKNQLIINLKYQSEDIVGYSAGGTIRSMCIYHIDMEMPQ